MESLHLYYPYTVISPCPAVNPIEAGYSFTTFFTANTLPPFTILTK